MAWWARTFQITGEKHTIKLRPYNKKWSNKEKNSIKYNYRIKAKHIYYSKKHMCIIFKNQNKKTSSWFSKEKKIACSVSETPRVKWLRKVENKSLGKGMPGKYQQTPEILILVSGTLNSKQRASSRKFGLDAESCPPLATPWTVAHQTPLSMGFSRQEYWSGVKWWWHIYKCLLWIVLSAGLK